MAAIVRALDARLLREREEERLAREARRQAAAFRAWMDLGQRPLEAFMALAPQVPTPGQLNPLGRLYERERAGDPSLRPTDIPQLVARQPAPTPRVTPVPLPLPTPPIPTPQPARPSLLGLGTPTIGPSPLQGLAEGFAPPRDFGLAPLNRFADVEAQRLQRGGEAARGFFNQVTPEDFPFLRRIASGEGPTSGELARILESDLPLEQQRPFFESFRRTTLARQQQAPALGALEIPFHFAGLGAERGLEAAGAPPGVQLGGNLAAQVGLGALGARVVPPALSSRLPGGVRTALDVAAVASTSEVRRPPRIPPAAPGRAAGEVTEEARLAPRFDVPTEQITPETAIPPGVSRVSPIQGQQVAELPTGQLELPLPRTRNAQEVAGVAAERRINAAAVREGSLTGANTIDDVFAAEAGVATARQADNVARVAEVEDLTKRSFDDLIADARKACRG